METSSEKIDKIVQFGFKSYYVVWKLFQPHLGAPLQHSLNRTMQYGNYRQAKSSQGYYPGLNRTMQYGNAKFSRRKKKKQRRLNRTMQYGNLPLTANYISRISCLNRTMQYGNNWVYFIFFFTADKFKSYYVVWKPKHANMSFAKHNPFKSYYVVWKRERR